MRYDLRSSNRFLTRRARILRSRRMNLECLEGRDLLAGVSISIADVSVREGPASYGDLDPAGAAALGLSGPRNIAFNTIPGHPHYNDLFVTSSTTNSVIRFDWETQTYQPFVTIGPAARIAIFGPDGNLYVSALNSPQILRYDGTDGHFLDTFVAPGAGGLDIAGGLTFGSDGNLYVCSQGNTTDAVLKYQGPSTGPNGELPGQFLGVFANPGVGSTPSELTFGPDGNLYVACPQYNTPAPYLDGLIYRYQGLSGPSPGQFIDTFVPTGRGGLLTPRSPVFDAQGNVYVTDPDLDEVLRYQGPNGPNPGAFIDAFVTSGQGGLDSPIGLAIGPDGGFYVADRSANNVVRFAPTSQAQLAVTLNSASTSQVSVNYATTNGTATAGGDYSQTSGTLSFAPGETTKTIQVPILDDLVGEPTETFQVNLSNAANATIADGQGVGTILDNETKFFVVDDTSGNPRTYEYGSGGTSEEVSPQRNTNTAPRGAASTAAGDKVWVVDANRMVYVYNTAGGLLGSWSAGSLATNATVEGITTNGTDIWIVDAKSDKVFRYTGAASRLSGSQNSASSFPLNLSNISPKDVVTDGTSLWVINDSSTDKVFKYNLSGSLLGSWTITGAGTSPTGITLDPSGGGTLWIVDNGTDRVYQFDNARSRTSGSQSPSTSFALAAGNTNPQGIADPPAGGSPVATNSSRTAPQRPSQPVASTVPAARPAPLFILAPDGDRTPFAGQTPAGPLGLRSRFLTARRRS